MFYYFYVSIFRTFPEVPGRFRSRVSGNPDKPPGRCGSQNCGKVSAGSGEGCKKNCPVTFNMRIN